MTGRITDSYSNIATVKLFSHGSREAAYAKRSMEDFMVTVHAQMRLATSLDTLTYAANILLTLSTAVLGIILWKNGQVGMGAIATATAMALRVNGLSRWIMWESARLFENIGTVNDGMNTLTKPHTIVDKPQASLLQVKQGEIKFNDITFAYDPTKPLLNHFNLTIKPGEKVGLIGRSGAGKSTFINKLAEHLDIETGEISKHLGRGRHTTRHTEFYQIDDFYIADTPGFSSLDITFIEKEDLQYLFREFNDYDCKFKPCNHMEEVQCGVKEAVESKEILESRYEDYKVLFTEKQNQKRKYIKER